MRYRVPLILLATVVGLLGVPPIEPRVSFSQQQALADLRVLSLVFDPASPVGADERGNFPKITVSSKISNAGTARAERFQIAFAHRLIKDALGNPVQNQPFRNLAFPDQGRLSLPGLAADGQPQDQTITLDVQKLLDNEPLSGGSRGTFEIRVVVDADNEVPEQDEGNNLLTATLTILPIEPKAGPELHVRELFLELARPPVRQGDPVNIMATVANTGLQAAQGFGVIFNYRPRGQFLWQPLPCLNPCENLFLPTPDGNREIRLQAQLNTSPLTPGLYEIRALVDPDNRIQELDEDNNEMIITFTLLDKPGLRFTSDLVLRSLVSNLLLPGQPLRASFMISSVGEDTQQGDFLVRFTFCSQACTSFQPARLLHAQVDQAVLTLDVQKPNELALPALKSGQQIAVEAWIDTSDLKPGPYTLRVEIEDRRQRLASRPELSTSFTVNGPDLEIRPESIAIRLLNPITRTEFPRRDQLTQGGHISISARIFNKGATAADAFAVEFRVGPLSQRQNVPGLGTGKDGWPLEAQPFDTKDLTPGFYQVQIQVDPEGNIAEEDEENNIFVADLQVLERPDLHVPHIFLAPRDETLSVSAQVQNKGQGPAFTPFTARFFYRRESGEGLPPPGADITFALVEFDDPSKQLVPQGAPIISAALDLRQAPLQPAQDLTQVPHGPLPAGRYQICVEADPENRTLESIRDNNIGCTSFEIPGPTAQPPSQQPPVTPPFALPDLVPLSMLFLREGQPVSEIIQGERVEIVVTVQNAGDAASGPFDVWFSLRRTGTTISEIFAVVNLPSLSREKLNPKESVTFTAVLSEAQTAALAPGDYEILVVVDPPRTSYPQGLIRESNEVNNEIQRFLKIKEKP